MRSLLLESEPLDLLFDRMSTASESNTLLLLRKLKAKEESLGTWLRVKLAKPGAQLTMMATLSSTALFVVEIISLALFIEVSNPV